MWAEMRRCRGQRLASSVIWVLLAISAAAAPEETAPMPANETADLPVTRPRVMMAAGAAKRLRAGAVNSAMAGDCQQAILAYRQFVDTDWVSADDFNNLAVCLQQEGRRSEALEEFEEGIKRFYHSEKLHQNLGLLLEELANEDFLEGRGGEPDAEARSNRATTHLTFSLRLQLARLWEKHAGDGIVPQQDRIGLGRKTVAIFCRPRNLEGLNEGVWGPSLVLQDGARPEHGEDAVIFLARHLVKLGFNVEVYANMPKGDVGMDKYGVMWRQFYAIHAMLPPVWNGTHVLWPKMPSEKMPNIFISWQNTEGAHLYNSSVYTARNITPPASYLWMHDIIEAPAQMTPWFMGSLHGIILMSRFQAAMTPARIAPCLRVTHVSIEQEPPFSVRQLSNKNSRFIYASSPISGLDVVLEQWPAIRAAIMAKTGDGQKPSLEVLYSFDPALDARYGGLKWYDALKEKIGWLLVAGETHGVLHHKAPLSQRKISNKLSSGGFILYPSSRAEAAAPHMARAMVMGCIPITSRTPYSALNETTWPFDLGPTPMGGAGQESLRADGKVDMVRIEENQDWLRQWGLAVVGAALADADKIAAHREKMVEVARERFLYTRVADDMASMFRADVERGVNGTCGSPVPQVVERRDPSERPNAGAGEEQQDARQEL